MSAPRCDHGQLGDHLRLGDDLQIDGGDPGHGDDDDEDHQLAGDEGEDQLGAFRGGSTHEGATDPRDRDEGERDHHVAALHVAALHGPRTGRPEESPLWRKATGPGVRVPVVASETFDAPTLIGLVAETYAVA